MEICFQKPGTFPRLGDSGPELKMHYPRYQFASIVVDMDFCFPTKTNIFKPLKFIAICVVFLLTESHVCKLTVCIPVFGIFISEISTICVKEECCLYLL